MPEGKTYLEGAEVLAVRRVPDGGEFPVLRTAQPKREGLLPFFTDLSNGTWRRLSMRPGRSALARTNSEGEYQVQYWGPGEYVIAAFYFQQSDEGKWTGGLWELPVNVTPDAVSESNPIVRDLNSGNAIVVHPTSDQP